MNRIKSYLFISVGLMLFLIALPERSEAQNRVNILDADRAEGAVVDGQFVRKLLGNVILETDQMVMEADSIYDFSEQNMLHAFNIQIETESEIIWADTLYYNTQTDYSELRGRVIVQSENNTVFSENMDAALALELIIFSDPVRFEDERGTLLAESGLYYQDVDSAAFRGNVQLADSTQYLESDSLFMNRQDDLYELYGRVYAEDFEDNVIFTGDYLYADSTGYRLLTGDDAWLMELSENEADTTHLLAKKIELLETDTTSTMDAFENVRIWSTKFSAIADTALYRDHEEKFELRSNPKLWQKNIQLTGPVIEAHLENSDIRFLSSYPRPIAVQEDTVTGRLHQMAGDTLHAYFNDGVVERIVVFDQSEIIFHQRDENDEPDGLIELIAQGSSTMYFLEGEFDLFKAERNIDGSYLPESTQNVNRRLDNFSWNPEQKPQRPTIQVPRLPTIPEERPFELPPRYVRYIENNQN
ncbi:OstA-like protein [Rhodohalobacter sp.]|uniref:OstA-like protein n=1 Tax=Rhodohalobacter sp. TaxID=1974210 RepID=UPI002ACE0CAA|nr:OstA-like protein [Rhodohalobacter sp.]MDZ7757908.1 OstA-like protein [Rhodohalobacter sp.]